METLGSAQAVPQLLILTTKPCLAFTDPLLLCPVTTAMWHKGSSLQFSRLFFAFAASCCCYSWLLWCELHDRASSELLTPCRAKVLSDCWPRVQDHWSLLNSRRGRQLSLLCANQLSSGVLSRELSLQGLSPRWHQLSSVAVSCSSGRTENQCGTCERANPLLCPAVHALLTLTQAGEKWQMNERKTGQHSAGFVKNSSNRDIWRQKWGENTGFYCVLPSDSSGIVVT